jgi:serine protease Do
MSDAASKGLQPGDVIRKVAGRTVNSASDVSTAIKAARAAGRKDVLILIARGGRHSFVPIALNARSENG